MTPTPTTKVSVTLHANYSDATAVVIANRWPTGDHWITRRQLTNARRRAGLREGDYFRVHANCGKDGVLVKTAQEEN